LDRLNKGESAIIVGNMIKIWPSKNYSDKEKSEHSIKQNRSFIRISRNISTNLSNKINQSFNTIKNTKEPELKTYFFVAFS